MMGQSVSMPGNKLTKRVKRFGRQTALDVVVVVIDVDVDDVSTNATLPVFFVSKNKFCILTFQTDLTQIIGVHQSHNICSHLG